MKPRPGGYGILIHGVARHPHFLSTQPHVSSTQLRLSLDPCCGGLGWHHGYQCDSDTQGDQTQRDYKPTQLTRFHCLSTNVTNSTRDRIGCSERLSCAMSKLFKLGLLAGLIAAAAFATLDESALAKKAPAVRKQTHASWYRSSDDVQCVERSFSISVGNPAYKNRSSIWPAPCGR